MNWKAFFVVLLFTFPFVSAQLLDISILENLDYKNSPFRYIGNDSGVFDVSSEFYNSGSVGYTVRLRLDVFDGEKLVFTGWSPEKILNPGQRNRFNSYWFPGETNGNFSFRSRFYFGNEIEEFDKVPINIMSRTMPEETIEISGIRVHDDKIVFDIESNRTIENLVITPENFPISWVVDQVEIDSVHEGEKYKIELNHEPSAWVEKEVKVTAISVDGQFYGEKEFVLEKEEGISRIMHLFRSFIDELF